MSAPITTDITKGLYSRNLSCMICSLDGRRASVPPDDTFGSKSAPDLGLKPPWSPRGAPRRLDVIAEGIRERGPEAIKWTKSSCYLGCYPTSTVANENRATTTREKGQPHFSSGF